MGEYLPEPAIEFAPMPIADALKYADMMKTNGLTRRQHDAALQSLADEVKRLRGELERLNKAAGELGEFILEQAG